MRKLTFGLIFLWFFLGGCALVQNFDTPNTPTPLPNPLVGTTWRLLMLGEKPVLEGSEITLHFGAQISGSAGCNTYKADYSATEDTIQLSFFSITVMACLDEKVNQQEQTYADLLIKSAMSRPLAYRIDADKSPSELHFMDEDGKTILLYTSVPSEVP
jgi:heat shock protein HslJ